MEISVVDLLTTYWSPILFLGAIIFSYANLKGHVLRLDERVTQSENDIAETNEEIGKMSPIWQEIRERLVSIETSLKIHFKDK